MQENYDVLSVTTAKDYIRLQCNYPRLIRYMPGSFYLWAMGKWDSW